VILNCRYQANARVQPRLDPSVGFRMDCRQSGSYHFRDTSQWVLISRYFRIAGYSPEMPIPSTDFVASNNRSNANQTTECSSMRTARPAARPPHPFFELRAHPFDMLPPCLISLDGDGPADPLVARERRYVFPSRQCLRVEHERFSEISRKIMCDSSGDLNGCHRACLLC
jgi:hypothetical protein